MPDLLKPWPGYAVVSFTPTDAVVNGSPMRTAFVCLLWALVLWDHRGAVGKLAAIGAVSVNLISIAARIYGQYHWFSGEMAGELLGAALAVALAPFVAARLRNPRGVGAHSP
ncbi:MAG: hypothetical protein EHM35_19200 [Planctomycetaceae bacterium]|nr:MAG: hypothetical protein EHM35_19200 [Planctomycetaceae bacterium]